MPNIPGAGVMTDTLDFVKNLWGSMGVVPGIAAPTLSVDELDKKINDLKAVEAWLNLNSSMVRGSIQALEVQRNTIATLKSMGKTLADAVQQQPGAAKEKSLFESIPYASAFFQHAADALSPSAAGAAPAGDPFRMAAKAPAAAPAPAPAAPATAAPTEAPAAKAAPTAAPMSDAEAAAAAAAPMVNAAAWWNLLQEQFKQAVTTAMTTDVVSGAAARATEAASKFAAAAGKPVAKADKGNLPAEQDKPADKKANGNGSGNGSGGKNGAATAARKAPAKKAASAKPGKE
jgi:hypothetical protein